MGRTTTFEVEIGDSVFKLIAYPDGTKSFHVDGVQVEDLQSVADNLVEVLSWLAPNETSAGRVAAHYRAPSGARAAAVLEQFRDASRPLTVRDVATVQGCSRSAAEKSIEAHVRRGTVRKIRPGYFEAIAVSEGA